MSRRKLKEIISVLRESPLYRTLSGKEKRSMIDVLSKRYSFLDDRNGGEVVGYESSVLALFEQNEKMPPAGEDLPR